MRLEFIKLDDRAVLPSYKHEGDSGFDLHILEDITLRPGETKIAKTGLAANIPDDCEIQLRPRSSLAAKTTVILPNSPGTIDACYRGEWGIILHNIGDRSWSFSAGDRVAQAVLAPVLRAEIVEVETLTETTRGAGAYGSTGKH